MKKRADKFLTKLENLTIIRGGKQLKLKEKRRKTIKTKKIISS